MEIVATKRLKDGLNFAIEYMKDGQLHCLFISAEKVVKNYEAVEQLRAADAQYLCERCGHPESDHPVRGCAAFARR